MLFRHHALALPPQSRFLWRERGDTVKVPETPDRAAVPPARRKARQAPPRKWAGTVTSRARWGYRQPSASVLEWATRAVQRLDGGGSRSRHTQVSRPQA